jgi:hypothetical protein
MELSLSKQARDLGCLFCGCLFVCLFVGLFSSSGVLVVLSILVCMIHHEGEKQASKQAMKQMGHHYLQMGGYSLYY